MTTSIATVIKSDCTTLVLFGHSSMSHPCYKYDQATIFVVIMLKQNFHNGIYIVNRYGFTQQPKIDIG